MPALVQLIPRLIAVAVLAVVFIALTLVVALGWLNTPDHDVMRLISSGWRESLHPLFQGIALLGGLEVTTLLMVALVAYLWRSGRGADAWIFVAFVAAEIIEVLDKSNLIHPSPPGGHADGPSLSVFLEAAAGPHNSYPSGHMVRAVLVYGLLAFAVRRLAPWGWARTLAIPIAVMLVIVLAFDRLYLDVHWESDVVGGIVLGAIALVSATIWLDRPRRNNG